jgi:hypothetical protein
MARLKFGALVSQISGSIGGNTIQKSSFGNSIRSKPLPLRSAKSLQLIRRSWMSEIQNAWSNLSEQQRNLWRQFVAYSGQKINNDSAVLISGYNLFLKYQFCRKLCNLPLLEEFTYIPIPQWPQAFIFSNVNNALFIQFDRTIEDNSYFFILSVSNPRIPSRSFSPQNCRYMFCSRSGSDIFSFTESYIQNFGLLAKTGATVHFTIYYFSLLAPLISGFSTGKAIIGEQFPNIVNPIPPVTPLSFSITEPLGIISPGGICFGLSKFCIYSYYTTGFQIALSKNGNEWAPHSTGSVTQLSSISVTSFGFILGAVWNNVYSLYFSADGVTWVKNLNPLPGWTAPICSAGDYALIFVFSYPTTSIYQTTELNSFTKIAEVNLGLNRSCAYGNGYFIAINTTGAYNSFAKSINGISWSVSYPNFEGFYESIIWANDRFCCVNVSSVGPASLISFDGVTWIPSNQNFEGNIACVAYGNGIFVGISGGSGSNLIYQSTDGLNWLSFPFGQEVWARAICFGNNTFVLISDRGALSFYTPNT